MTEITREQLTVENSQTTDAVASDFFTKRTLYTESRGLTVVSELYRATQCQLPSRQHQRKHRLQRKLTDGPTIRIRNAELRTSEVIIETVMSECVVVQVFLLHDTYPNPKEKPDNPLLVTIR